MSETQGSIAFVWVVILTAIFLWASAQANGRRERIIGGFFAVGHALVASWLWPLTWWA